MAHTKKTPEQRKAETDALRQSQENALLDLLDSQHWTNYLNAITHFRTYSLHNTLLILTQLPEATHVAGFHTWRKLGRYITSGPGSSIKIWGKPYRPKTWVPKGTEGTATIHEETNGQVKIDANFTRCPILSVFDISQTDGAPVPTISTDLTDDGNTARHEQVITTLTTWLNHQGWTVTHEAIGTAKGHTTHSDKAIALNKTNSTVQNVKTLIHEAAHATLHGDDTYAPISKYGTSTTHRRT